MKNCNCRHCIGRRAYATFMKTHQRELNGRFSKDFYKMLDKKQIDWEKMADEIDIYLINNDYTVPTRVNKGIIEIVKKYV